MHFPSLFLLSMQCNNQSRKLEQVRPQEPVSKREREHRNRCSRAVQEFRPITFSTRCSVTTHPVSSPRSAAGARVPLSRVGTSYPCIPWDGASWTRKPWTEIQTRRHEIVQAQACLAREVLDFFFSSPLDPRSESNELDRLEEMTKKSP